MQRHSLFVGSKSNDLLKYILMRKEQLEYMGVEINVKRVLSTDTALKKKLKTAGISGLPALITEVGVYCGKNAIISLYESNLKELGSGSGSGSGSNGEDGVRNFFLNSINEYTEDDEVGESTAFSSSFKEKMNEIVKTL